MVHLFEGTGQVLIILVSHVDVLLLEMTAKKVRRKRRPRNQAGKLRCWRSTKAAATSPAPYTGWSAVTLGTSSASVNLFLLTWMSTVLQTRM